MISSRKKNKSWRMILAVILLAGCTLALPTPEAEATDGEVSRKILGSSVVTSVSVIMDVGNGSQTYFSDAVGKPMTKPSAATQLASPINLLNPDRYEFYTFDDSGDLVKRLMTLDEIQGIIASGDGEASNYNSQSLTGDEPEKRVDDVVNNVQNVLKEEMEAHKTSDSKPLLDTSNVTSTWNMILPAIFGSSGNNNNNVIPDKQQNGATAETIMIEPTTLLPVINDTNVRTESQESTNMFTITIPDVTTEITSKETLNESEQIESSSENMDTPIISVEINNSMLHDEAPADSKTESSYVIVSETTIKDTPSTVKDSTLSVTETESFTSRPVIIISTPSPFTSKIETLLPSTIQQPSSPLLDDISTTSPKPSPSTFVPITKSPPTESSTLPPEPKPQNEVTTSHGQLSTFFLVEDNKRRPETTTTNWYSTPGPFTLVKLTTMTDNIQESTTKLFPPLTFTETKSASTENYLKRTEKYPLTTEDIIQENNKGQLNIDSYGNIQKSTQRTTSPTTKRYPTTITTKLSDNTIFSSTEDLTTVTTKLPLQTTTEDDENLRFSTPAGDQLQESTTENIIQASNPLKEFTKLPEVTTEKINDTENQAVTELLNQLLLTTSVYPPLNSDLVKENIQLTTETPDTIPTTEQINLSTPQPANIIINSTSLKPTINNSSETNNLVSSIEQLISQAIGNPEQSIENVKEGEKIDQVIQKTNSKPMSQVQIETATAASALIGTLNTESTINNNNNITLEDDKKVNQAVDSLISQIIYHQPIQTTTEEGFSTTNDYIEKTTILNNNESVTDIGSNNDIVNRYEELDLMDSSTITSNSESKTVQPMVLLDNESSSTTEIPEKTTSNENQIIEQSTVDKVTSSTELNQEETKHQTTLYSEIYGTTEKLLEDYNTQYNKESSKPPLKFTTNIAYDDIISTSTENLSKNNEILNGEASEFSNQTVFNTTDDEDFPTSTENFDSTSKSNEILKSSATELNYNENSSEPFLIVTSSSEYPDYAASTEIVDVFTKNINNNYDSTTSGELSYFTNSQMTTQNLPDSFNNSTEEKIQQTTIVAEPQTQTTLGNLQTTTDINFANEDLKQTTEKDFTTLTQSSTEKINFPSSTQQFNTMSITEQPLIFSSTLQPLSTIYQPIITITQQPLAVSTDQQVMTASTTQQPSFTEQHPLVVSTIQQQLPIVSTTEQQSSTVLISQPPITISTTQQQTTIEQTTLSTINTPITALPVTPAFVNLPTVTISPKIDKPAELKWIQNSTSSSTTTVKPDMTWTLVSTVVPHKTVLSDDTKTPAPHEPEPTSVDLVPKPLQGFGLEDSTSTLDTDVFQFTELCNELAFSFWSSVTSGISFARSVIVSPFAATSMLAMVFLGARGSTSGEMNEILKLDDMVTFNPHSIFKNVIESIEVSKKSGVAVSVFVKELYSDKNKGKLLNFYKERVKQFYDGHVEEANFKEINDVIRRRTNLLVKRQTWGKIPEYLKDNNLFARPPLAAVSANIFQTDCSGASTEGRDGELHFVVLPSIRQRKLVPIPAVVWRSGFLAGYDPGLDATAVAVGTKEQTISTIFVIPGQQGISAPGDGLMRLEARLVESAFRQGAWSRLLRSLIPRPGLEVQIPRFSHKSVINATMALQRMGLKDLFNSNTADLKGLNGVAHELYLSDIVQVNTFATCGEGRIDETHHSEVYPATTNRSFRRIRKIQHYHSDKPFDNGDILEEPRDYQRAFHDPLYDPTYLSLPLQLRPRQARLPEAPRLRFDRPFLYFIRHNPTGLILHMGRFNPRLLP